MTEHETYDVVVVGGGPGGLSAALVLGRARRRVLVVDAGEPRNRYASHVHGFLTRDGVPPGELLELARDEVRGYGVEVRTGTVDGLERDDDALVVQVDGQACVRARRVIAAIGTDDELPDVPGLADGWGLDVLHCPYCHGREVSGRRVAVLATHPHAAHQARLVRQWTDDLVLLVNDVAELDDEARETLASRDVRLAEGALERVERDDDGPLRLHLAGGDVVEVDALFTVPAMRPAHSLLEKLGVSVDQTPMGPAIGTGDHGRTNVPGVWAVGNVTDPTAQVVTAASHGALAGMDVNADLVEEDFARG
ncbi:NAD(P)/FAD-dependent oxidoreductase [Aeromicrobium massiliense]|uniref:NAD(P)/FAD-dependent oxidoreductase n=1 Tax=Aeromicrobium massiliense TaxID=1464554 RepID=UPI00031CAEF1|nr:NAD(P)/FAD-dependent oxidoreductase [Aeromicrobium massiliense]